MADSDAPLVSVMLAVPDAPRAAEWYGQALAAEELWNLGSVIGLTIAGAPLFLGEPANNGWDHPARLEMPSVRVEVFCDDPDAFIARAVAAGPKAELIPRESMRCRGDHIGRAVSWTRSAISGLSGTGRHCVDTRASGRWTRQSEVANDALPASPWRLTTRCS